MSDLQGATPSDGASGAHELDLIALSAANNELMSMHRDLAKKEALLREANEQKDRLLAMAAHDLRNPLSTITGFSQILQRRLGATLDEQDELLLRRIDAQAQRMLRLVEDLLETAVIEQGGLELELEDVDVHALLEEVVATQAATAARKDIGIALAEPDRPVTASIDRHRTAQVLDDLLSNATKYTPAGIGATIAVSCSRDDTSVRIRVEDEGVGIDPELLPRLFEPFVRSAGGTEGEPSTGPGLAITRSIVASHGGTIAVSSDPGHGSSFEVILPTDRDQCLRARNG